jgi:hypothetical protein
MSYLEVGDQQSSKKQPDGGLGADPTRLVPVASIPFFGLALDFLHSVIRMSLEVMKRPFISVTQSSSIVDLTALVLTKLENQFHLFTLIEIHSIHSTNLRLGDCSTTLYASHC